MVATSKPPPLAKQHEFHGMESSRSRKRLGHLWSAWPSTPSPRIPWNLF